MSRPRLMSLAVILPATLIALVGAAGFAWADARPARGKAARLGLLDAAAEKTRAAMIVGPERTAKNCAACHLLEDEAWHRTHHFTGFARRHRTKSAQEILHDLGQRTMKREGDCRQCHYTSVIQSGKVMPMWGVSCESCHGPGKKWVAIHDRAGGNPKGRMLKWGTGKYESAAQRNARLSAAEANGMISSRMIYDLASQCLQCHSVPDERLVNDGGHPAGSDFDLVAWSQGEMRHNFVDSAGAPDHPTNRRLTAGERRRMYVVGVVADLQFSLRNLSAATRKEGDFAVAMAERATAARQKLADILAAAPIPELQRVISQAPAKLTASTPVPPDLPGLLAVAGREFAARYDGSTLSAIDSQIPPDVVGRPYRP